MAGVNWLKKGRHWSRLVSRARTPSEVNARLIRIIWQLPDKKIKNDGPLGDRTSLDDRRKRLHQLQGMRLRLLTAVAIARHDQQEAARRQVAKEDCKRQLKAMLKLDDDGLAKAIDDCDTRTRAAIEAAKNAISRTPEAKWIPCNDPYEPSGMQVLAPETFRRAVEIALSNALSSTDQPGRPVKNHQHDLARACHEYWSACRPKGVPGRVAFTRAVFAAANWRNDKGLPSSEPEDLKNMERLLRIASREHEERSANWEQLRRAYIEQVELNRVTVSDACREWASSPTRKQSNAPESFCNRQITDPTARAMQGHRPDP